MIGYLAHIGRTSTLTEGLEQEFRSVRLWHVLLLVGVGAAACAFTFDAKFLPVNDNAAYLLLGKAISTGHGYVNMWTPEQSPAVHFPPGYPLIIAVVALFTSSYVALHVINCVFLIAALVTLLFLFVRLGVETRLSLIACVFVALTSEVLRFTSLVTSEAPYLFASALALYLFTRLDNNKKPYNDGWWWALMAAAGAAFYIRSVGIVLVCAFGLSFLAQRRWSHLGATLVTLTLLIAPWFIYTFIYGNGGYIRFLLQVDPLSPQVSTGDFASVSDIVGRVWTNTVAYLRDCLGTILLPAIAKALGSGLTKSVLGILLVAWIAIGTWKLPRHRALISGYVVGMFAVLVLWNADWHNSGNGTRFLIPLVPMFALALVVGCYELAIWVTKRFDGAQLLASWLPALLLLYAPYPLYRQHVAAYAGYERLWGLEDFYEMARWTRENSAPETVIATFNPVLFAAFSERSTVPLHYAGDFFAGIPASIVTGEDPVEYYARRDVKFMVIDQFGGWRVTLPDEMRSFGGTELRMHSFLSEYPHRLNRAAATGAEFETVLYAFDRDDMMISN